MDPFSIGPYRILEKIGSGGMGEVFLAEDTRLGRRVALKRLSDKQLESPEARHRLFREARAAATLNHPNIAVVYDVLEADGRPHIVMEYIEGETLAACVRRGPVPASQVLDAGIQIAGGLAEAHAHGVVHRDLKPANLIRGTDGKIKILDFGLARVPPSTESSASETGQIVGTPRYMSPEQLLGRRADPRSDIYSLGLILFELLAGKWPFDERGMGATLTYIKDGAPPPSELPPEVPADVSRVVTRAMAWDPAARYQSARELEQELLRLSSDLQGEATLKRSTWARRAALKVQFGARRWRLVGLSAVLVGLAVSAMLRWDPLFEAIGDRRSGHPVVAVMPLSNLTGDPSFDHVGVGIAHTLTTKLSALPSITIVSRTATLQYTKEPANFRRIAKDLGATLIVAGSIQRAGERLQVALNLVRDDDSVAWGRDYEAQLADLFDLQRRLAAGLTEALDLNLSSAQAQRLFAPPTTDREAYAEFSQGRYFFERTHVPENTDRAIHLFASAVARDPNFVLAYAALGDAYWAKFQQTTDSIWTEKARGAVEEARRIDPDHPAVRYALAVIYQGSGRAEEAVQELRYALLLQANNDDALAKLGEILAQQGEIREAAKKLEAAIEIRPNFWGHYRSLGVAYYNAGRLAEAVQAFKRVTELQPDLPHGFQMLGVANHQMGNLEEAVPNYLKAIELGPSWAAYSNLGTIYYRQGKFDDAAQAYRQALRLNPNSPAIYRNLGDACRRLQRETDARAAYFKAAELNGNLLRVNPKDARAMALLGLCQAKLGRMESARRLVSEAALLAPRDGQVLYQRAVVLALSGRDEESLTSLNLAIEHGYSKTEMREDDDLASLRGLSEFQQMVGSIS